MGRSRRVLDRKALRADNEAAERRAEDETEETEETEEEEDEDEEEGEGEGEGEADAEDEAGDDEDEGGDDDDEDAPKKKKKKPAKPKAAAKPKAKPRSRAAKIVRMKVVWGVFNNSNQRVATYEYPKRKEADDHAAKLTGDKKSTHFVQPVKEPIEEKAEKAEK
jgi:hypothetical protein